jgi:hypothetical protein
MTYTRTCTQAQVGITGKHFSDGSFGMGLTIPLTATAIWVGANEFRQMQVPRWMSGQVAKCRGLSGTG